MKFVRALDDREVDSEGFGRMREMTVVVVGDDNCDVIVFR